MKSLDELTVINKYAELILEYNTLKTSASAPAMNDYFTLCDKAFIQGSTLLEQIKSMETLLTHLKNNNQTLANPDPSKTDIKTAFVELYKLTDPNYKALYEKSDLLSSETGINISSFLDSELQPKNNLPHLNTLLNGLENHLKLGKDLDKTYLGQTMLHIATKQGRVDIVKALLEKGAKIEQKCQGMTPLNIAAAQGHVEVIKVLLEKGANIEQASFGQLTPLHFAVNHGHLPAVKILLEHGADIHTKSHSRTPLQLALDRNNDDIISNVKNHLINILRDAKPEELLTFIKSGDTKTIEKLSDILKDNADILKIIYQSIKEIDYKDMNPNIKCWLQHTFEYLDRKEQDKYIEKATEFGDAELLEQLLSKIKLDIDDINPESSPTLNL